MITNCKLLVFAFFALFLNTITAQTSKGQMGGVWYCSKTKEIFAIETDDDNSIKGAGVWYTKGGKNFRQMQIMTQTTTDEGYLLKCYDPANDKMVYDLKSYPMNHGVQIRATKTGNRSKIFYFENLTGTVPDTKGYKKYKGWEVIRNAIIDKTWTESKRPNSPLTFMLNNNVAEAKQDNRSNRFYVEDNSFEITTFLSNYGKVKMKVLFDNEWFLEVKDLKGYPITLFSGK
jgi:hypothetical protein